MSKRTDEIYDELVARYTFINFLSTTMIFDTNKQRYVPTTHTEMRKLIHKTSSMSPRPTDQEAKEVFMLVESLAKDINASKHLILFGDSYATQKVWNMETVKWEDAPKDVSHIVWRSSVYPSDKTDAAEEFLLQVAKGDKRHARDILQACAPLLLATKPLGVIWFSGMGRNGKSGVLEVLYRLLGDYMTKVTLHQIQDGKLTPILNGKLGNVVPESSEGYIDDSEKYKVIGEHGTFVVRRFHSQDSITVDTHMLHTIFNTNNIPNFADKSAGVRSRTIIVPFLATFKEDPNFFERTFTPEFLSGFLRLMAKEAQTIRDNGYIYKWGEITDAQKSSYDAEVNSAEAYIKYLKEKRCTGFVNWRIMKVHYENWCADNGDVPLGLKALKNTMKQQAGVDSQLIRVGDTVQRRWLFNEPTPGAVRRSELIDTMGLYFDPNEAKKLEAEEKNKQQSLLEEQDLA